MKKYLFAVLFLFVGTVNAAVIEFVPPNDPVGHVFSTNSNDGWSSGRGVVFQATADGTMSSIGLYHDLTGIDLSYKISETTSANGDIATGEIVLLTGNTVVTTNGLEWIDFAIADTPYSAGSFYHIQFSFSGNGNQNFFYDNNDVPFTQGSFEVIDGTQGTSTGNSVMPAVRLDDSAGFVGESVPVPALSSWSIALLLLLFGFIGLLTINRARLLKG